MGHSPVLNAEEENKILDILIENAKKGILLSFDEFIQNITKIIKLNNIKTPFKNGVPGPKWFMLFSKRNKKRFTEYENLIAQFHVSENICFCFYILNWFGIYETIYLFLPWQLLSINIKMCTFKIRT